MHAVDGDVRASVDEVHDVLQDALRVDRIVGDAAQADRGVPPQLLIGHLGRARAELSSYPLEETPYDASLVLQAAAAIEAQAYEEDPYDHGAARTTWRATPGWLGASANRAIPKPKKSRASATAA